MLPHDGAHHRGRATRGRLAVGERRLAFLNLRVAAEREARSLLSVDVERRAAAARRASAAVHARAPPRLGVPLARDVHAVGGRRERRGPAPRVDALGAVARRGGERAAGHLQRLVREAPPPRRVRLVPCARGGGVVAARRAHRAVRVGLRLPELARTRVVRHALDAQAQDAEVLQDGLHARRDHAEVLAAHELPGALGERRQHAARVFAPQRLLASVEVVVHEPRERVSRPRLERGEAARALRFDARVKRVGVVGVAQQTHVVLQRQQTGAHRARLLDEPVR